MIKNIFIKKTAILKSMRAAAVLSLLILSLSAHACMSRVHPDNCSEGTSSNNRLNDKNYDSIDNKSDESIDNYVQFYPDNTDYYLICSAKDFVNTLQKINTEESQQWMHIGLHEGGTALPQNDDKEYSHDAEYYEDAACEQGLSAGRRSALTRDSIREGMLVYSSYLNKLLIASKKVSPVYQHDSAGQCIIAEGKNIVYMIPADAELYEQLFQCRRNRIEM